MHQQVHHDFGRAFAIGIGLNTAYVVVELMVGLSIGSLSLIADAGHNVSDIFGLFIAWLAYRLARIRPTRKYTYGLQSTTIWASLANATILLVVVGGIVWEAIGRFQHPVATPGLTIIWVASIGVVINTLTALLFVKGCSHDLNIKGAFLHMAADAAVSLGVVIGGVAILATGWTWIDPIVSLLIAIVIVLSTWGLFRDSIRLAAHGVPKQIDSLEVQKALRELPGITAVHDLHVWALSTTEIAITAHLVKPNLENEDALLAQTSEMLRHKFGITHATIQIERDPDAAQCGQGCHEPADLITSHE